MEQALFSLPLPELKPVFKSWMRETLKELQAERLQAPEPLPDRKLSINQLIEYLPEHPAKQTVYGWCSGRKIPYQKHGSKLFFVQSDIDNWLDSGRVMSHLKND